jgi:hypothetical protein
MPKEIVSRMLRLPGSGISGWDTDEVANTPTLSIRQTAGEPYHACGGCGLSVRESPRWAERRIRVWALGDMDRVAAGGGASCPLALLWRAPDPAPGHPGRLHGHVGTRPAQPAGAWPHARIVCEKFHVLRQAREARYETRRAECFRHGAEARGLLRGKRWRLRRR